MSLIVTIELYGTARLRVGQAEVTVSASTPAVALAAAVRECPAFAALLRPDGWVASAYLLSVNGEKFVTEPNETLRPGDRLVVLAADAGG